MGIIELRLGNKYNDKIKNLIKGALMSRVHLEEVKIKMRKFAKLQRERNLFFMIKNMNLKEY